MDKTIKKYIRNNTNHDKTILVIGVFHGDEPQGEYFIEEYIKNTQFNGKNKVFYVPRLNSSSTRKNLNGVDLNRNFPTKNWELNDENSNYFGGHTPNSEVETQFLVDLIDKNKFDAIITIHAPFKIINYDCSNNCKITPKLAEKISDILSYPIQKEIGYPTPGSFGTYCGVERHIPTITIEINEEIEPKSLKDKFFELFKYLECEF